ncbi:uncharacterized protein LOC125224599 [Leguminivora glycinivorella]|uniref:uncharacterized protein LOC125224599 n=2 Tax=Leguminivora glycinivorella TaxID=1035111 RepID=UPI00200ED5B5|nr:uncharacterized protein LOC125224599 [Leguminivora glycinivorella]
MKNNKATGPDEIPSEVWKHLGEEEKRKTNKKNLHMVFIDLEKAFDHVPRDLIWEALRDQLVPESYISLIKDMYSDVKTQVMSPAECWATTKQHINKLHVTEMRMLRWSGGVTLLDKIRNDYIRGSFKVAPIAEKLKENRLRWYGHILRRPEDHMVKLALNMPTQKRGSGRPPTTWLTTVQKDMKDVNADAEIAKNRVLWRKRTRKADPT